MLIKCEHVNKFNKYRLDKHITFDRVYVSLADKVIQAVKCYDIDVLKIYARPIN